MTEFELVDAEGEVLELFIDDVSDVEGGDKEAFDKITECVLFDVAFLLESCLSFAFALFAAAVGGALG